MHELFLGVHRGARDGGILTGGAVNDDRRHGRGGNGRGRGGNGVGTSEQLRHADSDKVTPPLVRTRLLATPDGATSLSRRRRSPPATRPLDFTNREESPFAPSLPPGTSFAGSFITQLRLNNCYSN